MSGAARGVTDSSAILLVEDDEAIAEVIVAALSALGDVIWRARGEDGVEALHGGRFDLLVTDIELPGIDGIELLRIARGADSALAALILSGHHSFEYAVAAIRAGADDYMTKPVQPAALLEKANKLLKLSADRRREEGGGRSVLAIGAHPDDVEIGCGGILLRHVAEGDEVTVLTLTGGEAGGTVAERARESERAAQLMAVRLIHAGLSDTRISVSDGGVTIGEIERAIDSTGADVVYTHTERDVHQDHRNVHHATLVAARGVPHLCCYQAPSTTVEFHPTRFVAIDEFVERKIEVIGAFASQVAIRAYLDAELLRATARYWARFGASRYAEPLEVVRDATSTPVTRSRSSAASR